MKRFLGTTAILMALTGPALAQAQTENGFGSAVAQPTDFMASNLIGMRIYNSEAPVDANMAVTTAEDAEWDDIGEINDILLDENGDVKAVILGVGGFLGMGERDVAVDMSQITVLTTDGDNADRFLVVSTTKEMLEQAQAFEREMDASVDNASTSMNNSDAAATTAATTTAAGTQTMTDNASNDSTMASDSAATTDSTMASDSSDREMLTQPTVEREGYANASMEEMEALTAEDLDGAYVYGANDETVGEIGSLVMGDDGKVAEVVINVGGFLGLGEKPVAVTWDELQVMKAADGEDFRIYIDSTKEALEAQPEYQG
jgi:hypothetical protein